MSAARSLACYEPLQHDDSIRLLELIGYNSTTARLQGRLVTTRLKQPLPVYHALSYVWGSTIPLKEVYMEHGGVVLVRENLYDGLRELVRNTQKIPLWTDQICINQDDLLEREQQVKLMSTIFSEALLVVGWLGSATSETILAFKTFQVLATSYAKQDAKPSRKSRKARRSLENTGKYELPGDIFDQSMPIWKALLCITQLPWFKRLWIVQEVALASNLQLRCGSSTISWNDFFAGVKVLCSLPTIPPSPGMFKPFRNAFKLGKLREQVRAGTVISYPRLVQILSEWECEKEEDRLNAMYGMIFRNTVSCKAWFVPRYDLPSTVLYQRFAENHIDVTRSISILHHAGHTDGSSYTWMECEDGYWVEPSLPNCDLPSWAPDWRIRTRPLALSNDLPGSVSRPFSATNSDPIYALDSPALLLEVRALEVDQIVACGMPYCETMNGNFGIEEREVFHQWYGLAKKGLVSDSVELMFAWTLLMEGRVQGIEHQDMSIEPDRIMEYFLEWARHELGTAKHMPKRFETVESSHKSSQFGYQAEEVCRNRMFFITKKGVMGLGSMAVSPFMSIVLIHGLHTPFVVQRGSDGDFCRGECYVYGLMDRGIGTSSSDILLKFV